MIRRGALMAVVTLAAGLLCSCVSPDDGGGDKAPSRPATGTIGGLAIMPERTLLDSDTRDPDNPPVSNNSPASAQAIPNLAMVVGNVDPAADPDDYFVVSLNAGETVTLEIAESSDLDLRLYQGPTEVASSTGAGKTVESVVSPASADYFLRVTATAGASNYRLKIGALIWNSTSATAPPAGEIVAGEALVKVRVPSVSTASGPGRRMIADRIARRHDARVKAQDPQGTARMVFATGAGSVSREEARHQTLARIRQLRADPEVEYAEPNFIVYPSALPDDTQYSRMWNLEMIQAPRAWDLTTGSPDVVVAVIDTGVLYDHPDLAGNILMDGDTVVGYDLIADVANANDGDGVDPDPYDAGDESVDSDRDGKKDQSSYHGTHVAGTIGAVGNNAQGVAGVAWNVRIMPVRALGKDGGSTYDVAQGIRYAAGLANDYGAAPTVGGVTVPADIINLSLGQPDYSQTMQDAINLARSAGVTVVAAAGNNASSANFYPAAGTGVIGVSGLDYAGQPAYYSNFGTYVDLAAPGGDVWADLDNNGDPDGILSTLAVGLNAPTVFNYVFYQGTSMAAPHVAGVIALMKSYHALFAAPGDQLTPEEIDTLVRGTAPGIDSITNYPRGYREDRLGFGLIDAEKAVMAAGALAGNTTGLSADLELTAAAADFGFVTTSAAVGILNRGVEQLTNLNVSPYPQAWLSHSITGSVLTLGVDRSALANGIYTATLTVNSDNGGSETLEVKAYKGEAVLSDAGRVYVLLLDSTGKVVNSSPTSLADGYAYRFFGVTQGTYRVVAGTDLDNDGFIGDLGELFGTYVSPSSPQDIYLPAGKALTGRDFALVTVSSSATPVPR